MPVQTAHGPPDLLEVNMTEHSQNSPSSFSEEHNLGSPELDMNPDVSDDCCVKTEPNEDSSVATFRGIRVDRPTISLLLLGTNI